MDADINSMVKSCHPCRKVAKAPDREYRPWPETSKPWERLHVDYAGPFRGKMWMVCVDAHSKFPYVASMEVGKTTSRMTIDALKRIFSIEGLPETIVTDNGPQFTSKDFEKFCEEKGIIHITSPSFHPASNGEAERFVQTFKRNVDKNCEGGKELMDAQRSCLASYRSSPHPALDWKSPSEVLHGRQPRTLLSMVTPQTRIAQRNGNSVSNRQFEVGSMVYARKYHKGSK